MNDAFTCCTLCPRTCGANRHETSGLCGMGAELRVSTALLHHGEEPCISGESESTGGSGTIFFAGCALRCVFCQNHEISMPTTPQGRGQTLDVDDLTALMLELQLSGAHNINLVTPSHFTPLLRTAIAQAKGHGLAIPVVWNSSGYESVETLRSLKGLVDIYLPDLKYMDAQAAARYAAAPDYPEAATRALAEMFRQVGRLRLEDGPEGSGLAKRGLLIRLLVLPGNAGRADLALEWIAKNLGRKVGVSLMGQYYPAHRAAEFPELRRGVDPADYDALVRQMERLGLNLGYTQAVGSSADYTPDFLGAQGAD